MARKCDITGKRMMVGNKVSHSNRKSKRRFYPNLQKKRLFIAEENRWITLNITTSVLRTINKNGIDAVLKEYREKGTCLV
ncbi:MAG: 50S ribosomal protein L28 [Bacteroidales bacterium]|jgi:large subunit ribosomal protein L28|nr:50S ribosomal protein L28 [Bacteroidales bacterium]NCU35213.1 50S ribosomal protein L28 [Candidatus Falkowbacteria bacterium]MDD2631976.1 50S ribosomal protein L28 [Bacteroidales bacterium]MDD3132359.1 50S ribosomal protein L28 [Bacteroidales bacterium]MDD3525862.1 50S ribosomal protein L28 [Bacteroidales bacterium]